MRALNNMSLASRLTALVGVAFAITAVAAFVLMDGTARTVLLRRNLDLRGQLLEMAARRLDPAASDAAVLRELAAIADPSREMIPFALDDRGRLLVDESARDRLRDAVASLRDRARPTEAGRYAWSDPDGRRFWVSFRPLPGMPWVIGCRSPQDRLLADATIIRQRLVLVWIGVTALVLAGLAVMLRREMLPLRSLTEAATAMAAGDLDVAVATDGPSDVGLLARSFAAMRASIGHQLGALRESESRYRKIFDAMTDGVLLVDPDGIIVAANPQVAGNYGWTPAQLTGRPLSCLLREDDLALLQSLRNPPADRPLALAGVTCDRERRERETVIRAVRLTFQGRPHALILLHDITSQRRLERQLMQSQRLESVGRLAGGVAHDFNNLLTPILGYSEMLLADPNLSEEARADLEAIQRAGERARSLARQLLAFSHQQVVAMRELDLGAALRELEPVLRQTLREDIQLRCDIGQATGLVHADPGQIEQLVLNLAVNAMDAMPEGGVLEIGVDVRDVADASDLPQGTYACLQVRDSGPGIPAELLPRVCEPFFTTKESGRGLGLGLATVDSIVKQHGGRLLLRNRETGGLEVTVLLPCRIEAGSLVRAEPPPPDESLPRGHGETVILVEDDDMVRQLIETLLTKYGYAVRAYANGSDCLADLRERPAPADLLLTDVVMPGLNGPQLRSQLDASGIVLPTVFMSGYAGETLIQRGLRQGHADFLQKPLTPEMLLGKLRQMTLRPSVPPAP